MSIIETIMQNIFVFGKDSGKIGLSQFKENTNVKKQKASYIKKKDVKLSDLMRKTG